jgi:hypothetical protein
MGEHHEVVVGSRNLAEVAHTLAEVRSPANMAFAVVMDHRSLLVGTAHSLLIAALLAQAMQLRCVSRKLGRLWHYRVALFRSVHNSYVYVSFAYISFSLLSIALMLVIDDDVAYHTIHQCL